jgi:hypothetical protein
MIGGFDNRLFEHPPQLTRAKRWRPALYRAPSFHFVVDGHAGLSQRGDYSQNV